MMAGKTVIGSTCACALLVVAALLFVWPLIVPGTRANCTEQYIDARAGRLRQDRYILWVKVREEVLQTGLSRAYASLIGEPGAPLWRLVNRMYRRYSPHTVYAGALSSAHMLADAFGRHPMSDEAKREALLTFLRLLQEERDSTFADEYAFRTANVVWMAASEGAGEITVEDLPEAPTESMPVGARP